MSYKNILVGLDDSKYSEAALIEAAHWAKKHDGHITIVHAVFFDSEEFSVSPSQLDKRIDNGMDMCSRVAKSYSSEFGMEMECTVRQGEPHEVIPEVALQKDIDLIALGTYGRKGLKRLVMGSVTAGVMLHSPCDVLVVRKACEKCNGSYSSVLVPYDGSALGKKAIEKAINLKDGDSNAAITLIYVIPRYEEMLGFFKTNSIREKLYDEARKLVLEGENFASEKGVSVNTIIEEGSPSEKIVEASNGLGSEIIVMGSHGWSGMDRALLGSTTERVVAHSAIPVLVTR